MNKQENISMARSTAGRLGLVAPVLTALILVPACSQKNAKSARQRGK